MASSSSETCVDSPEELAKPAEIDLSWAPVAMARDLSCYVSSRKLADWRSSGSLVVIDVRLKEAYRKLRVHNSLNLPLRAVKYREHDKKKHLLLINEGFNASDLERTCHELRAEGFEHVGIYDGGLNQWRQKEGDLVGDRTEELTLNRVQPRDFFRLSRNQHWLILNVSHGVAPENPFPESVAIPYQRTASAQFRKQATEVLREHAKAQPNLYIGVMNQAGQNYEEIERSLSALGATNVFFLEGGMVALEQFQHYQVAMLKQRGLPRVKPCANKR